MRILHLIPSFAGGGAERQLVLLAREHAANGADVAIIYHSEGPNLAFLQDSNVTLFRLPLRGNHDPSALWKIIRIVRNWRPDLMQTWLPQMDILGGIAAKIIGIPLILSERASALCYGNDWKSRARAIIGRKADAIIANSHTGAQYWRDLDARGSMHVVVNAITPFETVPGATTPALQKPAILYAGRLAPQKNLKHLIAGLALAISRNREAHAYILGAGPQEDELRQWIAQTTVANRIHMIGYVPNLHPYYSHADVFVSVSDFEGHPNVVLEAASVGCPLVLSDIPEHREAVPSEGAIYVDGHEPVAIANALEKALQDKAGNAQRAMAAKAFVAHMSVPNQAARYTEIYQQLLGLPRHKVVDK